jgi:hypothetical protein
VSLTHKHRIAFMSAVVVIIALVWFWFSVAPKHWLGRVDGFGAVKLDERDVTADLFFGNPKQSEAESVVLIRVKNGEDYFFDFGSERVRRASSSEYLRLFGGRLVLQVHTERELHRTPPEPQDQRASRAYERWTHLDSPVLITLVNRLTTSDDQVPTPHN